MNGLHLPPGRRQRGVSLIEALIAFAVMALGMLGVMGVQTTLRFNSDVAKQRSEATRLAQEQMEQLRAFSVLATTPGARAYDDIASAGPTDVNGYTMTNTVYTLTTNVQPFEDRRDVTVTVAWTDRQDGPQSVVLHSVIAGIDPALSGALSIPPNGSPLKNPRGRHMGIPFDAEHLSDGRRSGFAPPNVTGVVWVFDNTTGLITDRCTTLNVVSHEVSGCQAVSGRLITGVIRFDTDGHVSAAEAENPQGSAALDVEMALSLHGEGLASPSYECFDALIGSTAVSYHCVVLTTSPDVHWSGSLDVDLVGRTLGTSTDDLRVCRYSADYNGRDGIENLEHPLAYTDVTSPLTNQNFLVIRGDNSCPTDGAARPELGDFVNSHTVEHAPNPVAS
jgi:Tfp pilus assembly protein PilV